MKKSSSIALVASIFCLALFSPCQLANAQAEDASLAPVAPSESPAQLAIKQAASESKHVFLFVTNGASAETDAVKQTFEAAAAKLAEQAQCVFVDMGDAAETPLIEKYRLKGAPMPLALTIAPNGVLTGAFYGEMMKDPQLQDSIASAGQQQCLQALQDGKLVFLCLQNATTQSNDVAMQGVNDFKADPNFGKFTEVVMMDPAAEAERAFLTKLQFDPATTEATTAFLLPPGSMIAKIAGATTKDSLTASLRTATAGGCGAGGCGPKGCGPKNCAPAPAK